MATIDWENLGFSFMATHCHIKYTWRDGEWSEGELVESPYLNIHIAASALHYGQAAFEGLKAFRCQDGAIRLFRPEENARRLIIILR
jgi:branched-chain amino acid aminotransferase